MRDPLRHAKLLRSVKRHAYTGFDFEGTLLCPADWIEFGDLWPQPDYPRRPVLLESAGPVGRGRGVPHLYVLWRYDVESGQWIELARTEAQACDWAPVLAPAARDAIAEQLPARPLAEASAISARIGGLLERELEATVPADRWKVLAILYEHLAARMAQWTPEIPPAGKPPETAHRLRLSCARAA